MGIMLFPSFRLGNAFGGGAVHLLRRTPCFSLYLLPPPPLYLSSPLFFSLFFLPPLLSHLLLLLSFSLLCPHLFFLFSFLPITLLFLSFSFVPSFFSFFLREMLVLSDFQDVIEDTASCNRTQFIRNKERLVMSMNFPIACLFYIIELFEVPNQITSVRSTRHIRIDKALFQTGAY